ncbi:hypothetical protein JVU11DRAFT_5901 [Chiua virens]|nr:hypothetical protein JVU11DRAFT_5901 [Chiua virens]
MAGAFSGHLLNAFNGAPAQSSAQTIITSGAMSFDSRAHGTPAPSFPSVFSPSPMHHSLFGFTPLSDDSTTAKNIATLQAKLNKKLGPEYISQRPGPGGGPKFTYAEGWKVINLANEVFGFNGWSSSVVSLTTDFVDYSEESRRFSVGATAIVRVTLRDGAYHEDVGYGLLENSKSKGAALDKCKKEAITDALKRTLRNFGNLLGNCLYDKSYAQEVVKIKVPPAKFDKNELYRRPEFEDHISSAPVQAPVPGPSSIKHDEPRVKVEQEGQQPETPIKYIPRHLRQEMATAQAQAQTPVHTPQLHGAARPNAQASGSCTTNTPANRGPISGNPPKPNSLPTPIQTPTNVQHPLPPRPIATSPLAPEHSVSFVEPVLAHVETVDQDMGNISEQNFKSSVDDDDDDDDQFPISTQDGVLFAAVDLGDLGRPIDFDEGIGSESVLDLSSLEAQSPIAPAQAQSAMNTYSRSVPPNSSSMGGSNVQSSLKQPIQQPAQTKHIPNPVPPAFNRTTTPSVPQAGSTNGLKRNVDTMQARARSGLPSSSARPPIQGMGLAQQQRQCQQYANVPRPSDEGNDPKRFKR